VVNAPHLVALVRAGATFVNGKLVERPDKAGGDQQVAQHVDPQVVTIARSSPLSSTLSNWHPSGEPSGLAADPAAHREFLDVREVIVGMFAK